MLHDSCSASVGWKTVVYDVIDWSLLLSHSKGVKKKNMDHSVNDESDIQTTLHCIPMFSGLNCIHELKYRKRKMKKKNSILEFPNKYTEMYGWKVLFVV